jgi:hypothetical protein
LGLVKGRIGVDLKLGMMGMESGLEVVVGWKIMVGEKRRVDLSIPDPDRSIDLFGVYALRNYAVPSIAFAKGIR